MEVDLQKTKAGLVIKTDHNSIRCPTLEISGTAIRELDGDKTVFTVPREQIRHISLFYDTGVKNPFCHYFLGFVLFLIGLIGLIAVLLASAGGHPLIQPETGVSELTPLLLGLWSVIGIGLWLLMSIFRARYQLLIDTASGVRKVPFPKSMDLQQIRQFIRRAHMFFGYEIDVSVLDKIGPPA
ncbi:MAG: hypothetical protein M0Z71_01120 [Nitrospiraceae bacterium]|nr:hypothetical protein [Nitrospiraceae bacterium]